MNRTWIRPNDWIEPSIKFKNRILGRKLPTALNTWQLIDYDRMPSTASEIETIMTRIAIRALVLVKDQRIVKAIPCLYIHIFGLTQLFKNQVPMTIWDYRYRQKQPDHDMPLYYSEKIRENNKTIGSGIFYLVRIEHSDKFGGYTFCYETEWKTEDGIKKVNHIVYRPVLNEQKNWEYYETEQVFEYE